MAATWDFQITVLDAKKKLVKIVATRTDESGVERIEIKNGIIETQEQKDAIMQQIRKLYMKRKAEKDSIAAVVGNLNAEFKKGLEAMEI